MKRSIVLATLVVLIVGTISGSASADRPVMCTLTPMTGTESAEGGFADRQYRFMAMWMASTDCDDPTFPLHGETAHIGQMARVSPQGAESVGGPLRMTAYWNLGSLHPHFMLAGQIRGAAACDAATCELSLDYRASGDRAQAYGSEELTINRVTGAVQSFSPGLGWISFRGVADTSID